MATKKPSDLIKEISEKSGLDKASIKKMVETFKKKKEIPSKK